MVLNVKEDLAGTFVPVPFITSNGGCGYLHGQDEGRRQYILQDN